MSGSKYDLGGTKYNARQLQNWQIARDCLIHMNGIKAGFELKKLVRRNALSQAAYAISKRFGHRSSTPDLYLWHPTLAPRAGFTQGDECIHVSELKNVNLNYRVYILGKQTQRTYQTDKLNATTDPNEICVYIGGSARAGWMVNVTFDLSGPALIQLCVDQVQIALGTTFKNLLLEKWGTVGVTFGNVDPSERIAHRKSPEMSTSNGPREAYIYRRYVNGVLSNWEEGIGWIT